jgi:tRNA pseudouridine13 synthase
VPDAVARATAIIDALVAGGAPNWYGEQRFGRDGDNAARGRALVMGGPRGRDRRMDRLMMSALQSQLFNDWLRARMADGLYRAVLAGDILRKTTGGQFVCDDPVTDQARMDAGELIVTGPMFGDRMRRPTDGTPAAAREDAILAAADLPRDAFGRVKAIAEGTRRDASIAVTDIRVSNEDAALVVAFALPGGAYATAVMREVMKRLPE